MMYTLSSVLGIVVAAVAHNVIGWLWYSPRLLGGYWMKESGMHEYSDSPTFKKQMMRAQIYGAAVSIVTAAVMACLMTRLMIKAPVSGILFGLTAWLGFVAPVTAQGVIWSKYKVSLWMVNNGFNAVSLAVMGLILTYFI